jgi:hypothetical protein
MPRRRLARLASVPPASPTKISSELSFSCQSASELCRPGTISVRNRARHPSSERAASPDRADPGLARSRAHDRPEVQREARARHSSQPASSTSDQSPLGCACMTASAWSGADRRGRRACRRRPSVARCKRAAARSPPARTGGCDAWRPSRCAPASPPAGGPQKATAFAVGRHALACERVLAKAGG